jgi:ABC-2 type transport system ATP-binding protein
LAEQDAIEVRELTRTYGELLAVDHVTFSVHQGEIFGFLGPNGAGKTTTIRMLTTLLEPTAGTAWIGGYDVTHQPYQAKRQFGIVPEESNIYTELSAWDNLMFTARLYRVPKREREQRARELLEAFGLQEKRTVKAQFFSRGMRRRLTIAMALIHRPAILFLDEPIAGLDAQSARAIRSLVQELNGQGTTVFLTTHQIQEASQLCDRVAIIDQGRIAAVDTPERLKRTIQSVQSVEVALDGDDPQQQEALVSLPGVTTAVKRGDKVQLYTADPAALLVEVMGYAQHRALRVISLNTMGPSLEDVFLSLTGQAVGAVRYESREQDGRKRGKGR